VHAKNVFQKTLHFFLNRQIFNLPKCVTVYNILTTFIWLAYFSSTAHITACHSFCSIYQKHSKVLTGLLFHVWSSTVAFNKLHDRTVPVLNIIATKVKWPFRIIRCNLFWGQWKASVGLLLVLIVKLPKHWKKSPLSIIQCRWRLSIESLHKPFLCLYCQKLKSPWHTFLYWCIFISSYAIVFLKSTQKIPDIHARKQD